MIKIVIVFLKGRLSAIGTISITSLNAVTLTVTWKPSFTLNLTTTEPDIVYCVDTYNVSINGSDMLIISVCNIIEPRYKLTVDSLDPRDLFHFIVTPRFNIYIEGVRNGPPSQPVTGYFPSNNYQFSARHARSSSQFVSHPQTLCIYIYICICAVVFSLVPRPLKSLPFTKANSV